MWVGPYVVPMDAYRRLMQARDWGQVRALRIFASGVVAGEVIAALAYWWGQGG